MPNNAESTERIKATVYMSLENWRWLLAHVAESNLRQLNPKRKLSNASDVIDKLVAGYRKDKEKRKLTIMKEKKNESK